MGSPVAVLPAGFPQFHDTGLRLPVNHFEFNPAEAAATE